MPSKIWQFTKNIVKLAYIWGDKLEKGKIISSLVFITGIIMISLGIVLQANNNNDLWLSPAIEEVDI